MLLTTEQFCLDCFSVVMYVSIDFTITRRTTMITNQFVHKVRHAIFDQF